MGNLNLGLQVVQFSELCQTLFWFKIYIVICDESESELSKEEGVTLT